jgi:CheY-like chemotaxis protein
LAELGRRPYVLLAEDIAPYLVRMRTLFEGLDLELIDALDGQVAIDYIEDLDKPLDLLITDLDMPRKTGWDVIKAFRSLRGEDLPIIMQTGEAQYSWVKEQAAELGIVLIDKVHVDIRLVDEVRTALQIPAQ